MVKVSIVVFAEMDDHADRARVVNALEAVKELKEHGDDVELIFDGGGVTSAVAMADPDHRLHRLYSLVEDRIGGICRYCARAFDVYEKAEELGLTFLAEYDQHPSLRNRLVEGYQIITF
ncbi:MAG: hypothetical protein P1P76_12450 [Anaerolineales bacterium]|nr:hypothetical protein [Anaerolineales bacterium]